MKYHRLQLTFWEKMACKTLSHLKYNSNEFYKCRFNDTLLFVAMIFLRGRDPINFANAVVASTVGMPIEEVEKISSKLRKEL